MKRLQRQSEVCAFENVAFVIGVLANCLNLATVCFKGSGYLGFVEHIHPVRTVLFTV